ncbi:MAG: tripartite tricarboxylate transporter substrate binding protein [Betaproteobacteria bacterium]|nr:tripartite tricarboxylate transporter substrate binding protein [Betaproteobacteria bacterium]
MHLILRVAVAAACSAFIAHAGAQPKSAAAGYPDKSVRWVVPFTPGASNDVIARLIAGKLLESWGQQFIIDNRPGAGGLIGAETVARAAPDGYTLLLSNPGPNVNSPMLSKSAPYKVDDFAPVIFFGYAPLLILANPALPVKNPKELLDYLKANSGKVSWGSSGVGSSLHIGLALFQAATGFNVTHVPYKGSGPAITDLIGGQIQFMHTTTVSAETQIKAGRVRVVGLASAKRQALLPDVPTLAEAGIKDAEAIVWFGMAAPAKTPRAIIDKLNAESNRILKLPDVKRRLDELGLEVEGGTPEQFGAFVKREVARIDKLIKSGALTRD